MKRYLKSVFLVVSCFVIIANSQVKRTPAPTQSSKDFRKAAISAMIALGNLLNGVDRESDHVLDGKLLFDAADENSRKYREQSENEIDLADAATVNQIDNELFSCLQKTNLVIAGFELAIMEKRLEVAAQRRIGLAAGHMPNTSESVPNTSELFNISLNAHKVHDSFKRILIDNSYTGNCPAEPASPPATPVQPSQVNRAPSSAKLDPAVNAASGTYRLDPDLLSLVLNAGTEFNMPPVSPQRAAQHLRELLERYDFDFPKALAAYKVGPERVERYGGVPPDSEVRVFVARIVKDYNKRKSEESIPDQARKP